MHNSSAPPSCWSAPSSPCKPNRRLFPKPPKISSATLPERSRCNLSNPQTESRKPGNPDCFSNHRAVSHCRRESSGLRFHKHFGAAEERTLVVAPSKTRQQPQFARLDLETSVRNPDAQFLDSISSK